MSIKEIIAIMSFFPVMAWFIASFIKLRKLYEKNEDKIKEGVKEGAEKVKETVEKVEPKDVIKKGAEKLKETVEKAEAKVEEKLYNANPENEQNDQAQSTTEEGNKPH